MKNLSNLCELLWKENETASIVFFGEEKQEQNYSKASFSKKIKNVAGYLQKKGVKKEDYILINATKVSSYLTMLWACMFAGAIPVITSFSENTKNRLDPLLHTYTIFDEKEYERIQKEKFSWKPVNISGNDVAAVFFTSGSTSEPKGVLLTHDNFLAELEGYAESLALNEKDIFASFLPMEHIFGFVSVHLAALYVGATQYLTNPSYFVKNPKLYLKKAVEVHASILSGMNFTVSELNKLEWDTDLDLSFVRAFLMCGEVLQWKGMRTCIEKYKVFGLKETVFVSIYGMTECACGITVCGEGLDLNRTSESGVSQGKLLSGMEISIVNAEKIPVRQGETGEIAVRGTNVFQGYLTERGIEKRKENEWFLTGDIGIYENGEVYIIGRSKDIILINGVNYYPIDIEKYIEEEIPESIGKVKVRQLFTKEQVPYLVIFLEGDSLKEEWMYKVEETFHHLYNFKISQIVEIEHFPQLQNGKCDITRMCKEVQRKKYKQLKRRQNEKKSASFLKEMVGMTNIWKRVLGVTPEKEGNFYYAGGDSIKLIRLIDEIQQEYQVSVSLKEFKNYVEYSSLCGYIKQKKEEGREEHFEKIEIQQVGDTQYKSFPLTEVQMSYWMGRDSIYEIGNISTHAYMEYEVTFPIERLEWAINEMIRVHPCFRTVITEENTQRILREIPKYNLSIIDATEWELQKREDWIEQNRAKLSHKVYNAKEWPLFDIKALKIGAKGYLLFSIDLMVVDAANLQKFRNDLRLLCEGKLSFKENKEYPYTFASYVNMLEERKQTGKYEQDKMYWQKKKEDFPCGFSFVYKIKPDEIQKPVFVRKTYQMELAKWNSVKEQLKQNGLSPTAVLSTIYAKTLSFWSNQAKCSLNFTIFDKEEGNGVLKPVMGDFTSTALISYNFEENKEFIDEVKEVQQTIYEALEHRYYSGIAFARDIKLAQALGNQAVAPFVFTSTLASEEGNEYIDLGKMCYGITQTSQVYLDCQVYQNQQGLRITWDFVDGLFDEKQLECMFLQFKRAVDCLADGLQQVSDVISVSKEDEKVIATYNDTTVPIEKHTLHGLFEEQVKKNPMAIAIKDMEGSISYEELDRQANQVAVFLQERGVKIGDFVAVKAWKRSRTIANILGILKVGAAYVPIDPDNPKERQLAIQENSGCCLCLDGTERLKKGQAKDVQVPLNGIAYVIYTSGSTGKPKGVMITHEAAANTIQDINMRFEVESEDCFLGLSSLCFDLSVYDIFGSLASGARLVMVEDVHDLMEIMHLVRQEEITIWNSVPAIMQMYIEQLELEQKMAKTSKGTKERIVIEEDSLRLVLLSGDWIPMSLPERIQKAISGVELISLGGATEASIWSIYYPIKHTEKSWNSIPYGYPLANQNIYILEENEKLCPVGVMGEICIGGVGVALGYQNDREKTERAFIHHKELGYIYKTGDYGVLHAEGYVEFLGRKDTQIKIHGHRIELGEITAAVKRVDGITEAVALTKKDENQVPYVVVYITATCSIEEEKLKKEIGSRVPAYMIPEYIIQIPQFPYTANGKLDRKKLEKRPIRFARKEKKKPVTNIQKQLAKIWEEVLLTNDFGINQDLFEVGGDSIKLIRIAYLIEKNLHRKVSHKELMQAATIERQAVVVENGEKINQVVEVKPDLENRYEPFDLTDVQRAYLMGRDDIFQLGGTSTHGYYEYEIELDLQRFQIALNKVIASQPMLRAVMVPGGKQKILPVTTEYRMEVFDARTFSEEEYQAYILTEREKYNHEIFHPYTWPLFRFKAVRRTDTKSLLMFGIDLLIMDASSVLIFKDLVMAAYFNPDMELQETDFCYRDFVIGLQRCKKSEQYEIDKKYWKEKAATFAQAPQLPLYKKVEEVYKPRFRRLELRLARDEWEILKKHCREEGVSPSAAIFTVYAKTLSFYSNQYKGAINLTLFNRYEFHPDIYKLVGDFTATMLLQYDFTTSDALWKQVKKVQNQIIESMEHRLYTGIEFGRDIKIAQKLGKQVPVPIVFTSTLTGGDATRYKDFGKQTYGISQTSQVYLDCQVMEYNQQLCLSWDYMYELLDEKMMQELFENFKDLLACLYKKDKHTLCCKSKQVEKFYKFYNDTSEEYSILCLHELFEQQVEKNPSAIAVKDSEGGYTYEQLNTEAEYVAADLIEKGVEVGDCVAVLVYRNRRTISYLLGVLKAGAAYVPIDPEHPKARQEEIIKQSGCSYFIDETYTYTKKRIRKEKVNVATNQLAYVIYTSGSTGKPKGVMITHEQAANTILAINNRYKVTEEDNIIGLSSMCFDLSVYDIFGALSAGATLVIVSSLHNQADIVSLVEKEEITIWNSVPAIMQLYIDYREKKKKLQEQTAKIQKTSRLEFYEDTLRVVLLSGDWIQKTLPERIWRELDDVEIVSLGGATEGSIWSIYYPITKVEKTWNSIPYGYPLPNQQMHIIGVDQQHCPFDVIGEICIGGNGVAVGYQNEEEKTKASFYEHKQYGRLYRTGDYGVMRRDGYIEFMGRKDNQVKVSGHRIELGEIENVLREQKNILDVTILLGQEEQNQIYAYVVCKGSWQEVEWKMALAEKLPEYMIPSAIIPIEKIPLTANGKIDRKKLLTHKKIEKQDSVIELETDTEKRIAEYWKGILDLKQVGKKHKFFECGGDSIKMLQLLSRLEEDMGVKIPYGMMMFVNNLEEMAILVESMSEKKDDRKISYTVSDSSKPIEYIWLPPLVGVSAPFLRFTDVIPNCTMAFMDYVTADSRKDLVGLYVDTIKKMNLANSIVIGGHSAGGNLAFEITKQLEKEGLHIKQLILLDSFYFKEIQKISSKKVKRIFRILIRENVLEGQELENINRILDDYIDKFLEGIPQGTINADILFIKSEPPYLEVENLKSDIMAWKTHTVANFSLVEGYGSHIKMLYTPYVYKNATVIKHHMKEKG